MSWLSAAWNWYSFTERASNGVAEHPHAALVNPVVAGIGALLLIGAALWQAATAQARHKKQTDADRERRITESFSKAVEQLGNDKAEVRLGGIYALERISRESRDDYWTVMETLTAFVREQAQWKDANTVGSGTVGAKSIPWQSASRSDNNDETQEWKPKTDIAAVLTVIIRRLEKERNNVMQRGVVVVTVNTGDDLTQSDDPTKVAMRQLAGVFAQFEKARLVQKLKSARDRKSQELGMRIEGPSYRRQRPEAFQALQELRAAHPDWSHPMLAEALEQQGFVTANGKRLAPTQVSRLLQQIEAKA